MTLPFRTELPGNAAVRLVITKSGATPDRILKQLPWALTYALNRSSEEALEAAHKVAERGLIIRRPKFLRDVFKMRRRASVKDFQKDGRAEARFGLRADDFRGRASIFVDHEEGGVRQSRGTRNGFLYLGTYGTSLRPTIRDLYGKEWYPTSLGLADRRAIEGGFTPGADRTKKRRGSVRGARRDVKAFVLRYANTGKPYAIARRIGPARTGGGRDANIEILWRLSQRRAIRPRLKFRATSERVEVNVPGMLTWALDKARTVRTGTLEKWTLHTLPVGSKITAAGVR
jgi:hypothetical protein